MNYYKKLTDTLLKERAFGLTLNSLINSLYKYVI